MPFARLTLRALGPALPPPRLFEALTTALGATLGLLLTHAVLWVLGRLAGGTGAETGLLAHPLLMAPLGASAVLIFAVPASPLAQPWSVVAGNTLAALAALILLQAGWPPVVTLALAAFAALAVMAAARCLHPPGGAVALATVLAAPVGVQAGLAWLGVTVFLGSTLLVATGLAFHRLSGRHYPIGLPLPAPVEPDASPAPPSPLVLAAALSRLRLEGTLGTEDLAHLIQTAETLVPRPALTAARIMTPEPISLVAQDGWREIADLFVRQGSRNLPVVDGLNRFLGLIPVTVILRPGAQGLTARHLMDTGVATATPDTPFAALLPPLAKGGQTCLPVLEEDGTLCGLITRSDIVAALVHAMAHPQDGDTDA